MLQWPVPANKIFLKVLLLLLRIFVEACCWPVPRNTYIRCWIFPMPNLFPLVGLVWIRLKYCLFVMRCALICLTIVNQPLRGLVCLWVHEPREVWHSTSLRYWLKVLLMIWLVCPMAINVQSSAYVIRFSPSSGRFLRYTTRWREVVLLALLFLTSGFLRKVAYLVGSLLSISSCVGEYRFQNFGY